MAKAKSNEEQKNAQGTSGNNADGKTKEQTSNLMTGELTKEEEQKLKQQYGSVMKSKVRVSADDVSVVYMKKADRNVTALAMSKRYDKKVLEAGEAILDNCLVAGDERCKTVDAIRIAHAMSAFERLDFLEGETEEL